MDFVTPILDVINFVWDPITRQINYVRKLKKNVEDLRKKRDELTSRGMDVMKEVERAKLQRRDPLDEVSHWLTDVKNVQDQVRNIEIEFEENKKWLCFPNYYAHRKLGKRTLETTSEVDRLKGNGLFEGGVAADPLPATTPTLPTSSVVGTPTTENFVNQILDYIKDEETGVIGVHGMGGVGKTTIMKTVNSRLKEAKHFHTIIWVTVSQDLNVKRLQADIAKKVQLNLSEDDDEVSRASELYEALMKRQRFLLILDDMWKAISLDQVGIPRPSTENGCKIALTTRKLDVCRGMKANAITVEPLSQDEAWDFFKDHVGADVVISSNIKNVAKLVAKECGGLPLALIIVGGALRGEKDVHEWRNALRQLQDSTTEIQGMEDEVFGRLKFSYDRLGSDTIRACFLYCSLYPEDYEIRVEEVIQFWIWEGLIGESKDMEAQIDNGYSIVNSLVRACMLESIFDREKLKYVKMHDLIRDMAIVITRDKPRFIVKAGTGLVESLKEEEWVEDVQRVSLMRNRICSLSTTPKCPKLTTLFLQNNPLSGDISPFLFQQMCGLRVLNLTDTSIQCLPSSLSELVNLHALILRRCKYLSIVPSLEKMTRLKALDLCFTDIIELPPRMETLANLKFLGISFMSKLQRSQVGLIAKLTRLEDLSIAKTRVFVEQGTVFHEIASLNRLIHLELSFRDLLTFSYYVKTGHWRRLKKFAYTVGDMDTTKNFSTYLPLDAREAYLDLDYSISLFKLQVGSAETPLLLPYNIHGLLISECGPFSSVSHLPLANVEGLTSCYVHKCPTMKCIWSEEVNTSFHTIPAYGVTPPSTFQGLKFIQIEECHGMKNLFPLGLLKSFQNLESIVVVNCRGMEELVADDKGEASEADNNNAITLPRLKYISLELLFSLKKICNKVLVCNSVVYICINDCFKLKKIPLSLGTPSVPLDGEITGSRMWWEALEWDDPTTKTLLGNLYNEEEEEEDYDEDIGDDDDDDDNDDDDDEDQFGFLSKLFF